MKRILGYMKCYWHYYAIGALAMMLGISLDLFTPIVTGRIIDEVFEAGQVDVFQGLALALIGITLGRGIFGYIKEYAFDVVGAKVICRLRLDLFKHIQSLSFGFFDRKNTGELMSRIKDDADRVWEGVSFALMLIIESCVSFAIATVMMLRISMRLSLLVAVAMPIMAYLAIKLEKTIIGTFEKISEQNATLNTTAQENIAGVRLVKAFAREKYETTKFLKHNEGYYKLNMHQARVWARFFPSIQSLTNLLPVLVVVFGGALAINEGLSVGTLAKFTGYMYMVIWPMRMFGWLSNLMAEARASAGKINKVFAEVSDIKNPEHPIKLEKPMGEVVFDHVSLELEGTKVLEDISFSLKPGKTLAVMGATGSGKTSLINLLVRFYDPTKGEIRMDGKGISKLDLENLRGQISLVMQDVFLFSDTINRNISFGSEALASNVIIQSAEGAQAHEFISNLEKDYDTVIGERGIGLSGGQKQRISIARALAKDAKVIVFDDSTSALDMKTELRIQKEIEKREKASKIIIAHRISAVKNADEIIILEEGKVVERGNHMELMAKKGRYYATYNEQYEGFAM